MADFYLEKISNITSIPNPTSGEILFNPGNGELGSFPVQSIYNKINNALAGWTEQYSYEENGATIIRKVTGYVGGVGSVPQSLLDNVGKYYAKAGGFTTVKADATDFKPEIGLVSVIDPLDITNGVNGKAVADFVNGIRKFFFGINPPVSGSLDAQGELTYIFTKPIPKKTTLKKVTLFCGVAGDLKFKQIRNIGASYETIKEHSVTAVIGLNTFNLPVDWIFESSDKIGVYIASLGVLRYDTSGDTLPFVYYAGDLTGSTTAVTASTNQVVEIFFEGLTKTESGGGTDPDLINPTLIGSKILNASFPDALLPAKLENLGGWTFANKEALQSTSGLSKALQSLNFTNFNKTITRAVFKLKDSGSVFGLFNRPITFAESGTIVSVDIVTNRLNIYSNWNGSDTLPSISTFKVLPFTLIVGRKYRLEIIHNEKDISVFIYDLITGESDSIITVGGAVGIPSRGYAYGKAGSFSNGGSIGLISLEYSVSMENPKVLFYGDSITEGYEILSVDCYSYRATSLIGNALISAQSSCTSLDIIERLTEELKIFKPKYIHVLIGTNESNMSDWSAKITTINNLIKSFGIVPIFGCLPANIQNTSQVSTWNAELLSKGFKYVRYDLATTVSNDGININTSLFNSDQRHPNTNGGLAMFNRLKLDAPELFEN